MNRYHYTDSWGNFVLSCPSVNKGKSCIPNRYTFTGREWDPDIALYHYRARWYDPETKRFTQEDPVFESANKYKYVDNNPILYYDPDGYTAAPAVLTTGWTIAVLEPTPFGDAIMAGVTIGILAYSAISLSKGGKQRIRDTELKDLPDSEISRRARDKSLPGQERNRYRKEEKAREQRNKQKEIIKKSRKS